MKQVNESNFMAAKKAFCRAMGYEFENLSLFESAQSSAYAIWMGVYEGNQEMAVQEVIKMMENGELEKILISIKKQLENEN